MKTRPQTVVCMSCTAKFHVPDELIRGKLVKFRCRKCGGTIDVDGRSASPPHATQPAPRSADVGTLETPATFADRTMPPLTTPSAVVTPSHQWSYQSREAQHTHTSTAPIAISEPPPAAPLPQYEALSDPSNRLPKIAAAVALLAAAGLSVLGFAMRSAPEGPKGLVQHSAPVDPAPKAQAAARTTADLGKDRPASGALKVTDLPSDVDVPAAPTARPTQPKAAALPTDQVAEPSEKEVAPQPAAPAAPQMAPPAQPAAQVAAVQEAPAVQPTPAETPPSEPAPAAVAPSIAVAAAPPAAAPPAAPPAVAPSPAPAPVTAPAAVNRARGDFNTTAAREALEDGAARASSCKTVDTPSGMARLAVTFAPTGQVTQAVIESGPFVGTAAGSCIATKFRALKIAPYSGDAVTVHKSIPF